MNSKNSNDLNDVQPAKSGEKKGYHGVKGQISQIPGLSPVLSNVIDVVKAGKRVGIRDTDSDYVKLAKQGGHKGLLYFDDTEASKPNSFEVADALLDGPIEALGNQRVICTKEKKSPGASSQRVLPPFWTDNMSAWERDDGSPRKEKKKTPTKKLVQWRPPSPNDVGNKFRRTASNRKSSPVNMSKLLRFGYIDGDNPSTNETEFGYIDGDNPSTNETESS